MEIKSVPIVAGKKVVDYAQLIKQYQTTADNRNKKMQFMASALSGLGTERLDSLLYFHDGFFAKEFADNYSLGYSTNFGGDTLRCLLKTFQYIERRDRRLFSTIIDLGSGPLTVFRALRGDNRRQFMTLDINRFQIEAGINFATAEGLSFDNHKSTVTSFSEIPIHENSVELALMSRSLHYSALEQDASRTMTTDRLKVLKECYRVLRARGYLIIIEPKFFFTDTQLKNFLIGLELIGFSVDHELSGFVSTDTRGDVKFEATLIVASKKGRSLIRSLDPNTLLMNMEALSFKTPGMQGYVQVPDSVQLHHSTFRVNATILN